MRAGGCLVQQALAAEAAAVVRQAVTLARRRGHAQVTPLHVASAMLAAGASGLLRAACLQSHSHPLQCKALELCFNVALNRLPAAAAAAAVFHHAGAAAAAAPALSNALVAAFKRAQAHQRRGGAVDGQPPALAAKVDLGQLVVSILDDPSVSRVMREAGFSSSQVKANVEKAVSSSPETTTTTTTASFQNSGHAKPRSAKAAGDDDAMRVLDCMAGGRRRCVVVVGGEGYGAAAAEAVVKAVMDRVSKAELHPRHGCLKNLQFVPLSAASFHGIPREEVAAKAGDLRALVRSGCAAGKGVVLVLEDLAYAADAWAAASEKRRAHAHGQYYCPVEHAVVEVSSFVSGGGGGLDRFWLLGFGSYPAFMKCRAGQPSLEAVWELHPVVVPDGGLALSLTCSSEVQATHQARSRAGWPFINGAVAGDGEGEASELSCFVEAAPATPSIPSWLRRYQNPNHTNLQLQDLWNPVRHVSASSPYHTSELTLSFSSPAAANSPASLTSRCYNAGLTSSMPWQLEPRRPPWPSHRHDEPPRTNPSPESMSVSSSSDGGAPELRRGRPKFSELTAENLKILCDALESRVPPRHRAVALDVASAVLRRRSGMAAPRRPSSTTSTATWMLFQGRDDAGKKTMAQEMAKLVFGSYASFTSISTAGFAPADYSDSCSGELNLKRQRSPDRDEHGHGLVPKLYESVRENPHQVIMIDDIEHLDHESEIIIKKVIEDGRVRGCNGDEIILEDAIIVLCCDTSGLGSRSRVSSPRAKQRVAGNGDGEEEDDGGGGGSDIEKGVRVRSPCLSFDLNARAEEIGEMEEDDGFLDDDVGIHNVVDGIFSFHLTDDL